jgi:hypothetical protein
VTETTTKRHSVHYFPSRERSIPTGHAFLLARDIPLGIMPIRGTRDRPSFGVELSPSADGDRQAWLIHFLHIGQYEQRTLEEALVDFVDAAATYIGYFGEVVFEILVDSEGEPSRLDSLPPGRILRTPRRYLQVVPKADREQLQSRRFVAIPRKRIWRLALPRRLGGPRRHRRLLGHLQALSDPMMPQFALESPDLGRASGYDFTAYHDAADRLQERATKQWGTVPSVQRPVGPSTEYYFIARRLAFFQAQARLREHMIAELNQLLARVTVPHSLVVSGIPTADEIAATLERLHNGEVTFAEAIEATRT